jgi:hypothetical protein
MIAIEQNKVKIIIENHKNEMDLHICDARVRVKSMIKSGIYVDDELKYLKSIYFKLRAIVLAQPVDIEDFIKKFESIIPSTTINSEVKKDFRNKIIEELDYKGLRSTFLPKYFRDVGIKSCVYCNSMLAITAESEGGRLRAKFQVDHFFAKSKFPFLSISLFNLYPVCGPCNNVKSTSESEFKLYSQSALINYDDYKFKLIRASVAKYLITREIAHLKIEFIEPKLLGKDTKSLQDLFDIKGIYNTQLDLAEELIIKARIYNKPYKNFLATSFPKLFNKSNLSNRVLIGNYTNPEDVHRRPMAKFTQDIAKQLKLI